MQHNLADLLKQGEGQGLDFKQKINSWNKIAKTISSFANTTGGIILVGVTDKRSLVGIDPEEEKYMLEEAALHYCKPPVTLQFEEIEEIEEEKIILKVSIAESLQKPHASLTNAGQWQVYIRQGDKSVPAGKNMIRLLSIEQASEQTSMAILPDKNEQRVLQHLEVYEGITVKKLALLINFSERRALRLLRQMVSKGLIRLFEHEDEDFYA